MPDLQKNSIDNKQIAKNAILLYVRMIITMGVSIYTSRVILDVLGVEDFGIYNVVAGVTTLVIFFSGSLSNAAQRYLSLGLGIGDLIATNKYFSQFQLIFGLLAVFVLLIGESLSVWIIESLLVIPDERIDAAYWVYHTSLFAMAMTFVQIPYQSAIIAHERMDAFAYISLFESFARLGILYIVAVMIGDTLIVYSFLSFIVSVIVLLFYFIYSRINFSECVYHYYFDKVLVKEMSSFVGYNMFGCFAFAAANQGVNVLLNIFFGPTINAARAISVQVNAAVVRFSDNIVTAVKPGMIKYYANNQIDEMLRMCINTARYCLYINFLVAIPIVLNIDYILNIWLTTVPSFTAPFIILVLTESVFNIVNHPITILVNATGKLKQNQFYGRMYTLAVLPIAYVMLLVYESPMIPLTVCILGSLCYLLNNLYDVKRQLGMEVMYFLKQVFLPCIYVYIPLLAICYLPKFYIGDGLYTFAVDIVLDILVGFTSTYTFLLIESERDYVKLIIKKITRQ